MATKMIGKLHDHTDGVVAAWPALSRRLASRRCAEKFIAWCHRKGIAPSEGRELLNKRHDERKARRG